MVRQFQHERILLYAGGTVKRDVSSEDLAEEIKGRGVLSYAMQSRSHLIASLQEGIKPGDVVLLMGARDPTLSMLAQEIKNSIDQN